MYPARCKLNLTTRGERGDQRISVISSTSSNTTSGIVSDRVHSEDEPDTAPASTECLPRLTESPVHNNSCTQIAPTNGVDDKEFFRPSSAMSTVDGESRIIADNVGVLRSWCLGHHQYCGSKKKLIKLLMMSNVKLVIGHHQYCGSKNKLLDTVQIRKNKSILRSLITVSY